MNAYNLEPRYCSQQSFYGKALVIELDGYIWLKSYNTIVAEIKDGVPKVYGYYSNTTSRHIKEFLKQHGFRCDKISEYYDKEK